MQQHSRSQLLAFETRLIIFQIFCLFYSIAAAVFSFVSAIPFFCRPEIVFHSEKKSIIPCASDLLPRS